MKRVLRIVLPIVLTVAILLCTAWYLFIYDREFTRDMLLHSARYFESNGSHTTASWFYDLAYKQTGDNDAVAIELAEQYVEVGNFTRAEYTLAKAIEDGGSTELYIALCQTFVAQDKLLDAVELLDNVRNPEITKQLNALRPQAPTVAPNPGFYSQYISVTITGEGGTLYANTNGHYPSLKKDEYTAPITLVDGENIIYAVTVNEEGIVSPLSIFGYTVGGIIEEVKFADAQIESAVREILNVNESKVLYSNDLWKITEFTVPDNATSFADLSYMQFMTSLSINGGPNGQLNNLSQMVNLTTLNIQNLSIQAEELPIIGNLPMLENLTLSNCSLSTTAGLENAKKVVTLDLSNNTIRNISALGSMKSLVTLNLQHNALTDLTTLSSLTGITKLDVSYNTLTTLSPICNSGGLVWLDASHNSLKDLSQLGGLTGLNYFWAENNSITDISGISQCTTLEEVNLGSNEITDASALAGLSTITKLNISHNKLTALPEFSKDSKLVTIDASHNQISSVSPLSGLGRLNNVYMDYNETLSSVSALAKCPVLIQVNVYGTNVKNVSELTSQSIIVNYDPT